MNRPPWANRSSIPSAQRTLYGGRWYHSKAEAGYAERLDWRLRAGEIRAWRPQVSLKLMVNGQLVCRYVVDFAVTHLDGKLEFVEVKGHQTDYWILKHALFRASYLHQFPAVIYTLLSKRYEPCEIKRRGKKKRPRLTAAGRSSLRF